jgi:hypothetical protein
MVQQSFVAYKAINFFVKTANFLELYLFFLYLRGAVTNLFT